LTVPCIPERASGLPSGAVGRRGAQEHRTALPARHPPELASEDPEQALQQFVNQSPWDDPKVLTRYRAAMREHFGGGRGAAVAIPTAGAREVGPADAVLTLLAHPEEIPATMIER
jgi:hypothetical protein